MISIGEVEWDGLVLDVRIGTYDQDGAVLAVVLMVARRRERQTMTVHHHNADPDLSSLAQLADSDDYYDDWSEEVETQSAAHAGETYAKLSVNVVQVHLQFGEFVVNHDTDSDFLKALLTGGTGEVLFEDTHERCSFGFVVGAPILRLTPTAMGRLKQGIAAYWPEHHMLKAFR